MAGFVFLALITIVGQTTRASHEIFFQVGMMILFSLLLRNIWLTLFLWWTVFLFAFFKFQVGSIYVNNIFFGCVLYYLTKVSFKKEHIDFFINAMLWFLVINLFYMIIQVTGLDWIYRGREHLVVLGCEYRGRAPNGFMANTGIMAWYIALCIPLLITRVSKLRYITAGCMLLPLWLLHSSISMIAVVVTVLFILWFRVKRRIWVIIMVCLLIMGSVFLMKVDLPGRERIQAWKLILKDSIKHPTTGWGLDSFRNFTTVKRHIYVLSKSKQKSGATHVNYWDNPHQLLISLFFEWGWIGLFILGGLLRYYGIRFLKAIKEPNTLALAGFGLALLIICMGGFPLFLARFCVFIIPIFAMFELQTE